jgi:ketosteroid isomerase-like protein
MAEDPRIQTVRDIFAAWSSGDADAPEKYFHADAVLDDIEGGAHHGWPSIRAFFAAGLVHYPDLILIPEKFWLNDTGVALTWTMSATVTGDQFGAQTKGKKWSSPGMSFIDFDGDKVRLEVDYHTRSQVTKSLGL